MNKRIKELVALQAVDDQNRFAEILIQDCLACCGIVEGTPYDYDVMALCFAAAIMEGK
jgi:hypothetical protein